MKRIFSDEASSPSWSFGALLLIVWISSVIILGHMQHFCFSPHDRNGSMLICAPVLGPLRYTILA